MTKKQAQLLVTFLEEYSERLGNDGCNDWDWPDDWMSYDKQALRAVLMDENDQLADRDLKTLDNFMAVDALAAIVRREYGLEES